MHWSSWPGGQLQSAAFGYQKALNTWVGADADKLVMQWGPPASTYKLFCDGSVLEYVSERSHTRPSTTTYQPVTTLQSGTYAYEGNDCTAPEE